MHLQHVAIRSKLTVVSAVGRTGDVVAMAAFATRRDRRTLLRTTGFLGEGDADAHAILARPGIPESVGVDILATLMQSGGRRSSVLELRNVPQGSWTHRAVEAFLTRHRAPGAQVESWQRPTFAVPLPPTMNEYETQFKVRTSRSFQEFQRKRRNLLKDFAIEFRVCTTDEQVEETFEQIVRIDVARWGAGSRYLAPRDCAFYRAAAHDLCRRGIYRGFLLLANGRAVTYIAGARVRDSFRVPTLSHDPTFPGRYSVGKVLNVHAIERCIAEGCREYDLTRGDEDYKVWLGGILRPNVNVRLYRSRLARQAGKAAGWVISKVRNRG